MHRRLLQFVLLLASGWWYESLDSSGMAAEKTAVGEIAAGDAAWQRRSDEQDDNGKPGRAQIDEAIRAYESALAAEPKSFAVRFKLMEAYFFLGHFLVTNDGERKKLFARSLKLTDEVMALLAEKTGEPDLAKLEADRQVALLKDIPEAMPAHFWAAINWGLWGLASGYYAAGREGVAARIRDHATLLLRLDENYADAGGLRLLGRLYTVAPRIPFATWWLDRKKGIAWLRQAHTISQRDPRNALFLAEALLEHEPEKRPEALDLLREAAAHEPDPLRVVEDRENINAARDRLKREEHRTP
jgi:hypothetical protein